MPEPLHPPYNITQPRLLVRWLDVNSQNGKLTRSRFNLVIPPFNIPGNLGLAYQIIMGVFDYIAPNNFSITDFSQIPVAGSGSAYALYVSYVNLDNSVTRYILRQNTGNGYLAELPLYAGQIIKKAFRIEIWNAPFTSPGGDSVNVAPITMLTSVLQTQDYRYSLDAPLAQPSALKTALSTPNLNLPFILPNNPVINPT